jgi:hypothetical protein
MNLNDLEPENQYKGQRAEGMGGSVLAWCKEDSDLAEKH